MDKNRSLYNTYQLCMNLKLISYICPTFIYKILRTQRIYPPDFLFIINKYNLFS